MKKINFKEAIPFQEKLLKDLLEKADTTWPVKEVSDRLYKSMIYSFGEFLANARKNTQGYKAAIVLNNLKADFKIAGIIQYHEPEAEGTPGNYTFTITDKESDLEGCEQFSTLDSRFVGICEETSLRECGFKFIEVQYPSKVYSQIIDTLKEWMMESLEDNGITLIMDNIMEISLVKEGDELIFSFIPNGMATKCIKNDDESSL